MNSDVCRSSSAENAKKTFEIVPLSVDSKRTQAGHENVNPRVQMERERRRLVQHFPAIPC